MPVNFIDLGCKYESDSDGFIGVDVVYPFDVESFSEADWDALGSVYKELPGSMVVVGDVPYWFGANESQPPWLSASVEVPGLQVSGRLDLESWRDWHAAFSRLSGFLPLRRGAH